MDFTEEGEMETSDKEQAWGREDLILLLHGIKENIPKGDMSIYTKGERTLEWDKVAFGPYSPQMCHQKWKDLSKKVRKIRSLAELVTEAEVACENPFQGKNWKIHPDFPKRPAPPSSIFIRENFKKFAKQQPEITTSELLKLINEKYNELPEHEKASYIAKFQKEKEMYEKSMKKLRKEYPGGKKVRRDHLKNIKGPLTPHGLWYRNERRIFLLANPDVKGGCIRQSIEQKQRWSELPDEEKLKWINLSLEQRRQYEEEEMEEHPENNGSRRAKHKPLLRKSERLLKDLADGKPDKPPSKGYNLFCKEQKATILGEGVPNNQYFVVCSQRWKTMSTRKKEAYQRRCDETVTDKEQQRILLGKGKSMFQGEPKKPPEWGHTVFYSEKMAELRAKSSHLSSRKCMARVSPLWRKLAQKEKEHYQRIAQERAREYQVELRSWFNTMSPKEQAKYLDQNPNKLKILDNPKQGRMAKKGRTSDSEDDDLEGDIDTSSDEDESDEDAEHMTEKENWSGCSSISSSSEEDSDME
ncbi:nucleolar transcription factor 1-like [Salvelinus fontinalis]|uniref:nucleolar transcription factor 1-like n=1 Tax=Salvelinus fontinalis TaxID=8038 RepID=UPI002486944C|nr:nucleolar transcription factor 1-like [Salvelinus fontinalis]